MADPRALKDLSDEALRALVAVLLAQLQPSGRPYVVTVEDVDRHRHDRVTVKLGEPSSGNLWRLTRTRPTDETLRVLHALEVAWQRRALDPYPASLELAEQLAAVLFPPEVEEVRP